MESLLLVDKFIDQVAVIADQRKFVSALIVPEFRLVEDWAREHHIAFSSREDLCANEQVKKMLQERGQEVSVMLDLEVPEDELMTRLIKRGQESGRADDNEETIKKRLVVYHSQTAPLIDWYKNDGKYSHINGLGTMDGIFADICAAIDKL